MNGSTRVSGTQTGRLKIESVADTWSKEDCLTLLERIRSLLPDGDTMKYKTTESHFDWEKVGLGGFTGDMCKQKWQKVSTEVRKYRTMTELIVDATEYVKNPYKGKKLKTHPDFPKKPLTPYFRFFMEKRAKYAKIHPEMSNLDLTKILSKKYKELPEKKKCLNGYSMYCAELMVNMKDVPSTERMVLCSKQWKMMTQKEKDMFQKRCEQKKKQYEIDIQRFLESLPEEERERVLGEEKLGGTKLNLAGAGSPLRAKSLSVKERCRDPELDQCVHGLSKEKRDGKKKTRLPETPKTPEEMWQQSVIGDYLAKYRNDRKKAQNAMDAAWKAMEKKEKIPWIKKAAEDQKRYEVQYQTVRELLEMRTVLSGQGQRKPKFDGEPKKPPVSGYQMFSQELLTNGELNHFSLKERMVEIGKRWHKLSQSQKDKYKKQVEEQQLEYKAELDAWVKSLSPQERAVYKEFSSTKRRSTTKARGPGAKVQVTKGKAVGARAATVGPGGGKRSMAYRAKQDTSDSDEDDEKTDTSDSEDEDDESSGSTDSEDDDEDDENDDDDDDDDDDQSDGSSSSSSEDSIESDSD
ncbi:nucleolar transcription factor 1-A-like [Sinocyclocheilus anshuiensis]|uniref:nucleolar transcription factor 1-A-like n=1 Tax=Sinocyclocheilus anshuiensis TaxID=1608454 RepID=UPI0007B96C5C|nr:PREDICTED: nucleolar transcription factor 1-A-like [Sinocyclocheilus anshuiensis]